MEPLPGYLDTGTTVTVSQSATAQLLNLHRIGFSGPGTLSHELAINQLAPHANWRFVCRSKGFTNFCDGVNPTSNSAEVETVVIDPDGNEAVQETFFWPCAIRSALDPVDGTVNPAATASAGPYRLGVRQELRVATDQFPNFYLHYRRRFRWFADAATKHDQSWGGLSHTWYELNQSTTPPPADSTPVDAGFEVGELTWGYSSHGNVVPADEDVGIISSINCAGAVDCSAISAADAAGSGSQVRYFADHPTAGGHAAAPPYKFRYRHNITANGLTQLTARLIDTWLTTIQYRSDGVTERTPQEDYIQCPFAATSYEAPVYSWDSGDKRLTDGSGAQIGIRFDLQPAWADAQDPPIPTAERNVPQLFPPVMHDLFGTEVDPYYPVTVTLESELEVLLSSNTWSSPEAGKLRRELLSYWRTKLSSGSPEYEICRANYPPWLLPAIEDRWYLGAYGWALLAVTVPAGGAGDYTVRLEGVHLSVTDNHETSRSISHTETPFAYERTVTLVEGANSVWVDLAFLVGGAFEFPTRVDAVEIQGTGAEDLTVTSLKLKAQEPGYLKCRSHNRPVRRYDYSAIVPAQDGNGAHLHYPDQAYKADELGPTGGAPRYVDPLTGTGTGLILDTQRVLQALWSDLGDIEGYTVVYSAAAFDAANEDAFGVADGPELAQWTWEIAPYARLAPGSGYQVAASPVGYEVLLVNATANPILVRTNWPIWGAIEALVSQGSGRAPASVTMEAYRTATGVTEDTGVTDASGFIVFPELRSDGAVQYDLREA